MEYTTIAISKKVKEEVASFGMKGESYGQIVERLLESAKKRQLHDLLMSREGCVTIDEAIAEAEKRWPK